MAKKEPRRLPPGRISLSCRGRGTPAPPGPAQCDEVTGSGWWALPVGVGRRLVWRIAVSWGEQPEDIGIACFCREGTLALFLGLCKGWQVLGITLCAS